MSAAMATQFLPAIQIIAAPLCWRMDILPYARRRRARAAFYLRARRLCAGRPRDQLASLWGAAFDPRRATVAARRSRVEGGVAARCVAPRACAQAGARVERRKTRFVCASRKNSQLRRNPSPGSI